jgi:DNA adenine methylase Dam
MKPLFKWTGGKGRLLSKYEDVNFFPDSSKFDTFVDLFCGSGATFLWVAERYPDKKLIINDLNTELVDMYLHIRNDWDVFLGYYEKYVLEFLGGTPEERKELYDSYKPVYAFDYVKMDPIQVSALLLVMMKTNFNGIWKSYLKWNSRYSTPAGTMTYKTTTDLFNVEKVKQFRDILRRSEVLNLSFEQVSIPERSWIFADPPYRATEKMYSDQFNDKLQSELAVFLQSKDCLFAESNKEIGDGFWQEHFPNSQIHFLDHKYTCGAGANKTPVTEVLIKNYGEQNTRAILPF